MAEDLPILSPPEARVLGCLAEKKELTPDVYPLTLNSVVAAANQKTAREPVMGLDEGETRRALSTLEAKGLVRKIFASRVERYEHLLPQKFSLAHAQIAVLALLLLRGPQTVGELLARAERLTRLSDAEEVRSTLDMLIGRRPPLVQEIGRGPGQREDRFAHLLSGPVEAAPSRPAASSHTAAPASSAPSTADLEARVEALERQVAELQEQLKILVG